MNTRAYNKTTLKERNARFVDELRPLHDRVFPEQTPLSGFLSGKQRDWKTVRHRPEVTAIIEALVQRAKKNIGVELTTSEVIAAMIVAALPRMVEDTRGAFR